jgi:hypothetical protein
MVGTFAFNRRLPLVILFAVVGVLIVDTSMNRIYYQSIAQWIPSVNVGLFTTIVVISLIGQIFFLRFVKVKTSSLTTISASKIELLRKAMWIIQSSVMIILLVLIIQMVLEQHYYTFLLTAIILLSTFSSLVVMLFLAVKFFSWFKRNKNLPAFLYGVAATVIVSNIIFGTFLVLKFLEGEPSITRPSTGILFPYIERSLLTNLVFAGYNASLVGGFIVAWLSTVLLLNEYKVRWAGRFHWAIIVAPLVYFLFSSQTLFTQVLAPLVAKEPALYSSIYVLLIIYSKPIGGFIFGAAFWSITRTLHRKNIVMDYTIISAYGFILLFLANNLIILASAPYPPYGLAAVSFLGLSCFMVLLGIYLSVISISHNRELRRSIKKLVEKSNLLDSISVSEITLSLEKETQQIYSSLADKMREESGVAPILSASEAREYCNKVINEISRLKERKTNRK